MALDLDQQLSPHFVLRELTRTSRRHIDNTPDESALFCLQKLVVWIGEPLRGAFGPLWVTSGYRSKALNTSMPGASNTSAHMYGCAMDLVPMTSGVSIAQMMAFLAKSALPFDQAIDEINAMGDPWLHVSIVPPGSDQQPRRQLLMQRGGVYSDWIA